jgi:hypothetical protein
VALVLSLATGLVSSLQYHLPQFDNYFETMKDKANLPKAKWMEKCHFKASSKEEKPTTISSVIKRVVNKFAPAPESNQPVIPAPATITESEEIQEL